MLKTALDGLYFPLLQIQLSVLVSFIRDSRLVNISSTLWTPQLPLVPYIIPSPTGIMRHEVKNRDATCVLSVPYTYLKGCLNTPLLFNTMHGHHDKECGHLLVPQRRNQNQNVWLYGDCTHMGIDLRLICNVCVSAHCSRHFKISKYNSQHFLCMWNLKVIQLWKYMIYIFLI